MRNLDAAVPHTPYNNEEQVARSRMHSITDVYSISRLHSPYNMAGIVADGLVNHEHFRNVLFAGDLIVTKKDPLMEEFHSEHFRLYNGRHAYANMETQKRGIALSMPNSWRTIDFSIDFLFTGSNATDSVFFDFYRYIPSYSPDSFLIRSFTYPPRDSYRLPRSYDELRDINTYKNAGWDISYTNIDLNDGYPFFGYQIGRPEAQWVIPHPDHRSPKTVSVSFYANDADGPENALYTPFNMYSARVVNIGSALGTKMPPNPVREGHTFKGWYTANGARVRNSTVLSSSVSVTARWN